MSGNKIQMVSGKRKTAVAKVKITQGGTEITFNHLPINELPLFHKLTLLEPIRIYERTIKQPINHSLQITTKSGGKEAQIQAARLALAKALLEISKSEATPVAKARDLQSTISKSEELRKAFLTYDRNLIVPDFRRKEACKPGDSKARAKRQKSYR